ncbi:hypothetical protein J1N35_013702 [Gossypium stocksii]|uniref:Aminotransferase-like plant mobile domain-containing protein n=1 Tax=Gossypium stocksii TaxID=47602 RepID=A0A9D3VVG1_9ROSI|nr:hypothetical protein J1N35_013702 [Gossypium stocksii]
MDIIHAARELILQLIGGILLPDVNQNKVHIMYLPLLEDLELAGGFSWGSAVLACLYRDLCRATKPSTKKWAVATFYYSLGHYTECHFYHQ